MIRIAFAPGDGVCIAGDTVEIDTHDVIIRHMRFHFTFANNVVFNWRHRTTDGGDHRGFYNIINNYDKPGPVTPRKTFGVLIQNSKPASIANSRRRNQKRFPEFEQTKTS